jgi:hypothetical protein
MLYSATRLIPSTDLRVLVNAAAGKHFDPAHGQPMKEWFVSTEGSPSWLGLAKETYNFVKRISS